mmetsp:Transcript_27886/g.55906  ORF Transcript_27886/g.55906 Transcript_27886/m.55906 type:complete len:328 (-) Transcript_27886:383-1366(-)
MCRGSHDPLYPRHGTLRHRQRGQPAPDDGHQSAAGRHHGVRAHRIKQHHAGHRGMCRHDLAGVEQRNDEPSGHLLYRGGGERRGVLQISRYRGHVRRQSDRVCGRADVFDADPSGAYRSRRREGPNVHIRNTRFYSVQRIGPSHYRVSNGTTTTTISIATGPQFQFRFRTTTDPDQIFHDRNPHADGGPRRPHPRDLHVDLLPLPRRERRRAAPRDADARDRERTGGHSHERAVYRRLPADHGPRGGHVRTLFGGVRPQIPLSGGTLHAERPLCHYFSAAVLPGDVPLPADRGGHPLDTDSGRGRGGGVRYHVHPRHLRYCTGVGAV